MHPWMGQRRGTLLQYGVERIQQLCPVLGFDARDEKRIVDIFGRMASGWGHLRVGGRPRWPSDITDDHSPFELSLAIDGDTPELRVLAEIQDGLPTMQSNWSASLAFNDELVSSFGVSLDRFQAIKDLFAPTFSSSRFCAWHAVCFRPGEEPDFKLYLNPSVRGRAAARDTVEEAMRRLGFGEAGSFLPASTVDDVTLYFSLDLASSEHARVKAYTGHHGCTAERVEGVLRAARGYVPGQITEFCKAMGGPYERYDARPVQTCLSFTAGSAAPTSGTVYFPVRSYADSDLEVRDRVLGYIQPEGAAIYRRALQAFANRPLEDGVGMQSYVSLRQGWSRRRMTVYLAPEGYAVDRIDRSGVVSGVVARGAPRRDQRVGGG